MEKDRVSRIGASVGGEVRRVRNSSFVTVEPGRIKEACKAVVEDGEFYHLSTITGVDEGQTIAILYHFWRGKEFITLRATVPKADPRLPSVSGALPAALFYEAEVMDLLGVVFEGNPLAGRRLLLPDNYPPEAPPPLRTEADPEKIRKMMGLE